MKEMYWVGTNWAPKLTRKQKKLKKSTNLQSMWHEFLMWANMGWGESGVKLYSNIRGIVAYSFIRKDYPKGDEFDRMRIRVTGAMPLEFKQKLINELKSGKRHMREF